MEKERKGQSKEKDKKERLQTLCKSTTSKSAV
jgi:hypothetical protein